MAEHRSALSPAAARLLASVSRQIVDRLPDPADAAADTSAGPVNARSSSEAGAAVNATANQPRVTCEAAVLDAPVPSDARCATADGGTPAWHERRDVSNVVAVTCGTLQSLNVQSGALVKVCG